MNASIANNQMLGGGGGDGRESPFLYDPLIVELNRRGGEYEVCDWLGQAGSVSWPVNALPTATLEVALADGFGVNVGSQESPQYKPIDEVLDDATLVRIRTARQDPETDFVLFEGRVDRIQFAAHPHTKTAMLSLSHLADELKWDADFNGGTLCGQYQLTLADWLKLQNEGGGAKVDPRRISAEACIFNPDGKPNCLRQKVAFDGADKTVFPLGLFCDTALHDKYNDQHELIEHRKQSWTWGRVYLYLLFTKIRTAVAGQVGDFTRFRFGMPVIQTGENETKDFVEYMVSNGRFDLDPDETGKQENPLEAVILGKPVSHVIEGRNWQEAWDWTCIRSGLSYLWESYRDDEGGNRWRMRLFVPGAYQGRSLKLPSPAFRTDDKTWELVRQQADLTDFDIERDFGNAVNFCRIDGAPMVREVTVQLAPGWKQNADWDVWDADGTQRQKKIDDAVAAMGTDAWAKKYVLGVGALEGESDRYAGRLWMLNTTGAFTGYGRKFAGDGGPPNGTPWVETGGVYDGSYRFNYDLLDPSKLNLSTFEQDKGLKRFAVRARPFQACLTGPIPGQVYPPIVELSFDKGGHWHLATASVDVSQADARVYFNEQDLRNIRQTNSSWSNPGMSLPEAYIRGELRVRVTAGLELDDVFSQSDAFDNTLSKRPRLMVIQKRGEFQKNIRDGAKDQNVGNSIYNSKLEGHDASFDRPARTRDDTLSAIAFAQRWLKVNGRIVHRGPIELPELVFPYEIDNENRSGWRPGDVVESIQAESDAGRWNSLQFLASEDSDGAVVAAVNWQWKQPAGEEAFGVSTRLQLEDVNRLVRFG